MKIGYTIVSINENRAKHKRQIRERLHFPEITDIEFVDGRSFARVQKAYENHPGLAGKALWGNIKKGELGIWLSHLNAWKWLVESDYDALIFLEDDAIISQHFYCVFDDCLAELVEQDWDLFSICVPDNQYQDFHTRVVYDDEGVPKTVVRYGEKKYNFNIGAKYIAKAYQGYCCVANMFSRQGAERMLHLADKYGMYTPVDCFLFLQAHRANEEFNAFAPMPHIPRMVNIDWKVPTTIQDTERVNDAV